jgi:hypothetical protein
MFWSSSLWLSGQTWPAPSAEKRRDNSVSGTPNQVLLMQGMETRRIGTLTAKWQRNKLRMPRKLWDDGLKQSLYWLVAQHYHPDRTTDRPQDDGLGSDQDVDVDLHWLAEHRDIRPSYFRRLHGLACDGYLITNNSFRVDLPHASRGSTAGDDNVQFGKMLRTWWIG